MTRRVPQQPANHGISRELDTSSPVSRTVALWRVPSEGAEERMHLPGAAGRGDHDDSSAPQSDIGA
jgi:hypothetical protein